LPHTEGQLRFPFRREFPGKNPANVAGNDPFLTLGSYRYPGFFAVHIVFHFYFSHWLLVSFLTRFGRVASSIRFSNCSRVSGTFMGDAHAILRPTRAIAISPNPKSNHACGSAT
jgi:hypothetical protein